MKFYILSLFLLSTYWAYGDAALSLSNAQHAQVSVAVMPFLGTDLSKQDELTATSMRDGVLHRLFADPNVRVVIRRRAYALSLDAEILIDDPTEMKYRTPADYVIFGNLLPVQTGDTSSFNLIAGIYEASSGNVLFIQEVPCGSDDPEVLAESFYNSIHEVLHANAGLMTYDTPELAHVRPKRIAMLPVWVMGAQEYDFWEISSQLIEQSKLGLGMGWPTADIIRTAEVIEIIEAHGLNQIGGRADAYAENVARVLGADHVLLVHLNAVLRKAKMTIGAWDLC
ncbi:hypothetical protein QEH52_08495 [Coraliomargarita sp. SDUM461003]|uniref:Uncharacterized protein n=1 Tax=Thalassobacterium maritimum TaxID=3041265 RepID=A0ABU1AWM8_9BACT|nr:hypothetical protein [Coraliomargarita sp. SDUM461003]MDQ8207545.1 hypothetical protein [Coraliomargarita sp. SDUM461003]